MAAFSLTSVDGDDRPKRLPAGRKSDLAAYVAEVGQVTVAMVAERYGVSIDTIRRDLDQLDAEGALVRTHGGAVSLSSVPRVDSGLDVRLRLQTREKETIGALAASLVENGSVMMINAGTTTLAVARHLGNHRELTVATNNLRLPGELSPSVFRDLYVFGGAVRSITQATTGPVAFHVGPNNTAVDIQADIALIAVGAVAADSGYSTSNLGDAAMMADMMTRSKRVAILADSSKFGRRLFGQVSGLEGADYFVTNETPPDELREALQQSGVQIVSPEVATPLSQD
ncbi:DeoR/GlpR family DNA-binding transcription regulator [Amnibacterium flavum]|uniref:Transcriptional regulator n=1 Tax=Amnibacterium flavum TaxID=2173173 RepID=A0A2V1HZ95_9MICO|nr:DeoR/GlpR family DNA-binding transcription regulator [Amnibacterium flavum]PVZ96004.1 transcriptional regulator [Amnibacterium flavum]